MKSAMCKETVGKCQAMSKGAGKEPLYPRRPLPAEAETSGLVGESVMSDGVLLGQTGKGVFF